MYDYRDHTDEFPGHCTTCGQPYLGRKVEMLVTALTAINALNEYDNSKYQGTIRDIAASAISSAID